MPKRFKLAIMTLAWGLAIIGINLSEQYHLHWGYWIMTILFVIYISCHADMFTAAKAESKKHAS